MTSAENSVAIADWLASRAAGAPTALLSRLSELAGEMRCEPREIPHVLVEIATRVFDRLDDSRESALELLAADALITYAMEAAAELGVENASESAMTAIAGVVSR